MVPPTVTAQEHKVSMKSGKPIFYDPPQLKAAKAKLEAHLAKHAPEKPTGGPVELTACWCFPITGNHHDGDWKTSRPDTDNLQKALKDCMSRVGYWRDDAQVVREIAEKRYATIPGILIMVSEA
jgi:Holliday junction resolvase RusA-like endonuclease